MSMVLMSLFPSGLGSHGHLLNEAALTTLFKLPPFLSPTLQSSTFNLPFSVLPFLFPQDLPFVILNKFVIIMSCIVCCASQATSHTRAKALVDVIQRCIPSAKNGPCTLLKKGMKFLNLSVWSVKWEDEMRGCRQKTLSVVPGKKYADIGNCSAFRIH